MTSAKQALLRHCLFFPYPLTIYLFTLPLCLRSLLCVFFFFMRPICFSTRATAFCCLTEGDYSKTEAVQFLLHSNTHTPPLGRISCGPQDSKLLESTMNELRRRDSVISLSSLVLMGSEYSNARGWKTRK